MTKTMHSLGWMLILAIMAASALSACGGHPTTAAGEHSEVAMAPMGIMPGNVKAAPATVQQAYQYAAANPGTLQHIPCYCGCGSMGHTSNYSCYVQNVDASGSIQFDEHALGCGICVDITQDVIRLQKDGKKLPEIRAYIDGAYGKYGPSNMK